MHANRTVCLLRVPNMGRAKLMVYLCRLKTALKGFKKGEEAIFPESFVKMFREYLEILKEYPGKIDVVIK